MRKSLFLFSAIFLSFCLLILFVGTVEEFQDGNWFVVIPLAVGLFVLWSLIKLIKKGWDKDEKN